MWGANGWYSIRHLFSSNDVLHTIRGRVGKGLIGATFGSGHCAVVNTKVADMHFVDDPIFGRHSRRAGAGSPAAGRKGGIDCIAQVDKLAAWSVVAAVSLDSVSA
jgi:hypothetical protein